MSLLKLTARVRRVWGCWEKSSEKRGVRVKSLSRSKSNCIIYLTEIG